MHKQKSKQLLDNDDFVYIYSDNKIHAVIFVFKPDLKKVMNYAYQKELTKTICKLKL
jgi:hypothetical protein